MLGEAHRHPPMSATDSRVLDHDPLTGITEYYTFDPHTGGFVIETVQDVTATMERNVALWNSTEKHSRYGEWCRIASIPNTIVMELAKLGIMSPAGVILDEPKYRRWLNDSDNLKWRTRAGKV